MSVVSAFAKIEAENREAVLANTFGHLAPKANTTYRGKVVFAIGCYGGNEACVLRSHLTDDLGNELPDSPWWYTALTDVLSDIPRDECPPGYNRLSPFIHLPRGIRSLPVGGVFAFWVTFRNYQFSGFIRQVF